MTNEDLKNEISKLQEQIDTLKKIIVRLERIESTQGSKDAEDDEDGTKDDEDGTKDDVDPYKKLAKYSYEALNQVKRDLTNALEKGNELDINEADDKTKAIIKMVDDVIKSLIKIKKQDEKRIAISNPLYPYKKLLHFLPGTLRLNLHSRGAIKWVGFLLTGVGVVIFSRGIWDAADTIFSIQGSLIIGAAIIILMAWLERKKLFAVFGEG